ncbi:C2 domain containing protein [Histomonas meleagridis]|uniref:C2 domain containing protein n=1 Tax=Histomonas meleagridis TaxID=135588 RepID=UPI00355A2CDC|nr:C2 domain containing protein [Histomonas meleagridis]KAH0802164.1 C2 domain containing protein [Histomonas meleagridis]
MFRIYVISGKNLPAADRNGKSDPYAVVYAKAFGSKIKIGKTKIIKKTLDPVWDEHLEKPFAFYFPFLKIITIKVYDYDYVGKDDYLGKVKINFLTNPFECDRISSIPLKTSLKTKGPPTIEIMVSPNAFSAFKTDEKSKKDVERIVSFLEFNPPLKPGHIISTLSYYVFDRADGGCARRVPRESNHDDYGIKVKFPQTQVSSTGITPYLTFNATSLQTHPFSSIQLYYVPIVEILDGYTGTVTLKCLSFDPRENKIPTLLFQEHFQFQGKDVKSSQYYLHISDGCKNPSNVQLPGGLNVLTHGGCLSLSSFNGNLTEFVESLKAQVLFKIRDGLTLFHRLEVDLNKCLTLNYVANYFKHPIPKTIIFYGDYQSPPGFPLDEGIEAYDIDFNPLGNVCFSHRKDLQDCMELVVDRSKKFDKFKNETLYLKVKLFDLPPEVRYLLVGISQYQNKPFPLNKGGYFRLYDESDMFEFMNLTVREKGEGSAVLICLLWKMDDGDWAFMPMHKSFEINGSHGGLPPLFALGKKFLTESNYLDRMKATMSK